MRASLENPRRQTLHWQNLSISDNFADKRVLGREGGEGGGVGAFLGSVAGMEPKRLQTRFCQTKLPIRHRHASAALFQTLALCQGGVRQVKVLAEEL